MFLLPNVKGNLKNYETTVMSFAPKSRRVNTEEMSKATRRE
jgi:hypothetical protein